MPGFHACSKLLKKYEQDKAYRLHKQKLAQMRPTVDAKSPKRYPHVVLRLKRIQQEEERQAEVDHENKILLQKMTHIMRNRPAVDNWNEYEPKSLHAGKREQELQELQIQNIGIARRLERAKPVISKDNLENDYQKKCYIQSLWADTVKEFGDVTPRHLKYRQMKKHKETTDRGDSEEEYDDEDNPTQRHKIINRDSLPPINIRYMKDPSSNKEVKKEKLPKIHTDKKDHEAGSVASQSDRGSYKSSGNHSSHLDTDAKQLFNASKQIGKVLPENVIIRTLVKRTRQQRMQVKDRFEEMYDLELVPELKNGLGSDWYVLIDALLDEKNSSIPRMLHDALEVGDYVFVVEMLSTTDNQSLAKLGESYNKEYAVSLENDIKDKCSDPEKSMFLSLMKPREGKTSVDDKEVEKDADALYGSGDGRWSSESGPFLRMLSTHSFAHVRAVLNMYRVMTGGKDAVEDIKRECPREYAEACVALAKCIQSAENYYADKIFKKMSPTDADFVTLLVARSEIDMPGIKRAYKKKYDAEMVEDLKHKCQHPTINVLIELINKVPQGQSKKKKPPVPHGPFKRPSPRKNDSENLEGNPLSQPSQRVNASIAQKRKEEKHNKEIGFDSEREKKKEKEYMKRNVSGTILPFKNFHPDEDCQKMHTIFAEKGSSEDVIEIISCRCNGQRQHLKKVYHAKYKKNLTQDLEDFFSGDVTELIQGLMMTPAEYDVYSLHEALDDAGISDAVLVGILSDGDIHEKKEISDLYKKTHKEDLTTALKRDSRKDFSELLVLLSHNDRAHGPKVNGAAAKMDAAKIFHDEPDDFKVKNETFIDLLVKKSHQQVRATFEEYEKLAGKSVYDVITNSASVESADAYIALCKAIANPVDFYAEKLNSCFRGLGTNNSMLTRIVVSRSEIDLGEIKSRYRDMFGEALSNKVTDQCTGDYRDILLKLIGH